MIKIGEFFMIRELYQKGWTIKAISEKTGFDPKTIRKYLKQDGLPSKKKVKWKGSILDPYKQYILQRIKERTTNCAVLLDEVEHRESVALEKRLLKAKLPFQKTIHEFEFDFQPSVSEKRVKEVLTCRFIENGDNVLLLGPQG